MRPNWNILFGHLWPDRAYTKTVTYMKEGPSALQDLPKWVADALIKRVETGGYELNHEDRIILRTTESELPWYQHNNGANRIFVFEVIKVSECESLLKSKFMDNMNMHSLNCKSLSKRVLMNGYLGISRRFIKKVFDSHTTMETLNTIPTKPVIKSFKPNYPFEHWQMDLIDLQLWKHHNKNYKYVFVIIDIFSKFVYLYPLKNKQGKTIAGILNKLLLTGDIPMILHSDQGSEFIAKEVEYVCNRFHVKLIFGESYSPQTQGFVESKNKYIKRLMNYYIIEHKTYTYLNVLEQIAFTINNTQHSVTKTTPMLLHRGRQIPVQQIDVDVRYMDGNVSILIPTDHDLNNYMMENEGLYTKRVSNMREILLKNAIKQDKKYNQEREYNVGDLVCIYTYHKPSDGFVQPVIIKTTDGSRIQNPLTLKNDKHVNDVITRAESFFKKMQLKTKKLYPEVFVVQAISLHYVELNAFQMKATVPNWTNNFSKNQLLPYRKKETKPVKPEYEFIDLSSPWEDCQQVEQRESVRTTTPTPVPSSRAEKPAQNILDSISFMDVVKHPMILSSGTSSNPILIKYAFRRRTTNNQSFTGDTDVRTIIVKQKRSVRQTNDRGMISPWDVKYYPLRKSDPVLKVGFAIPLYGKLDTTDGWEFVDISTVQQKLFKAFPKKYTRISS